MRTIAASSDGKADGAGGVPFGGGGVYAQSGNSFGTSAEGGGWFWALLTAIARTIEAMTKKTRMRTGR
jgi:hypothetical protein